MKGFFTLRDTITITLSHGSFQTLGPEDSLCPIFYLCQYLLQSLVSTDTTFSTDTTKPELILSVGSRGQKPFTPHASQLKMRTKCA